MRIPFSLKLFVFGTCVLILVSLVSAFAAGISVPYSNVGQRSLPVTAEDIKPSECGSLYLTNTVSGSGTITGTAANDLIIGSAEADIIDGLSGNDCIVAGGGNDSLAGSDGNDVCLGGSGNNTFAECEVQSQ